MVIDGTLMKVAAVGRVNGLTLAKQEPADIVPQLMAPFDDTALRKRLAGAARTDAEARYSVRLYVQRLETLYARYVAPEATA